jgi:hypothetical protein
MRKLRAWIQSWINALDAPWTDSQYGRSPLWHHFDEELWA